MHFAFNEQQQALKESARKFLQLTSSLQDVLRIMETESGYEPDVWKELTRELGWTALPVPEAYGGLELPFTDLTPLLEEMGYALFCGPYFSTICLGVPALLEGGTEHQKEEYLPRIASGDLTATLAYQEPNAPWPGDTLSASVESAGDHFILNGEKAHVLDGHTADLLIIAARTPGTKGDDGVSLFAVPKGTPGLTSEFTPTLDQTRKQAKLLLNNLRLPNEALLGPFEGGGPLLQKVLDLAGIALAAEQVGAAERCLDTAVDYAKVRFQFGRAIGSFQAIKHKCADMMVQLESARSAAYYASWVAAEDPAELASAAAMAQSFCSSAFFKCAAENIQIHGGIGFTWEHEAHVYFKRAQSSKTLLGTPAQHRARVAHQMGL